MPPRRAWAVSPSTATAASGAAWSPSAAALSIFVVFALAIWSQLTIGWQWSAPDTVATSWAMPVMSAAIVAFGALCVASAVPVLWSRRADGSPKDRTGRLLRPLLLLIGGLGVLVVGTHHFANGWPGTGGHPWVHQGIVPGGVAAWAWASTLFVTSYWAHPAALAGFPAGEVAWMVVSPIALAAALVGIAKLVRRLELSPRLLRYQRRLTYAATVAMAAFFTGAGLWVFDGGPGPRNLFHVGAIDVVDLVAMAVALAMTTQAVRRVGVGARRLSPAETRRQTRTHSPHDLGRLQRAGPADPAPVDPATGADRRSRRRGRARPGRRGRASSWSPTASCPGKQELDQLDGACSVAGPSTRFADGGRSISGSFSSRARRRRVGYTIAWPPGAAPGTPLPLVVMLHGYGADHTNALTGMTPAEAVSLVVDGQPLPPMAMVTVDGGGGYWNPHPGDNPMEMVVSELIPAVPGA